MPTTRRTPRRLGAEAMFWGWAAVLVVSFVLYVAAPGNSVAVRIGGRTVVNVRSSLAQAASFAFARDGGSSLTCYFAATTPEYIACGPVVLNSVLGSGWDNFQLSTTRAGAGVKVRVSDGVVIVGTLPAGTQMTTASGRLRRLSAEQSLGAAETNGTLTRSYKLLGLAILWAVISAFAAPERRRRLLAVRAAETQAARHARAAASWEALALLPSAPAVSPPRPVLVAPPAPPPSTATATATEDDPPGAVGGGAVGTTAEVAAADGLETGGDTGVFAGSEESDTTTAEGGVVGHRWSGPAVLMLGPVMVVGWAAEPERRIVTELAAYLACHQERPRSAEEVQAAVWPLSDSKADVSLDTVRQHLSRLRRALGESHLPDASKVGGYQLDSTVNSDWFRFQALAEAARLAEGVRRS